MAKVVWCGKCGTFHYEGEGPEIDKDRRIAELEALVSEIEGQAVCVGLDGDKGNERMLTHIVKLIQSHRVAVGKVAVS